jgi:hypothetical protein
MSKSVYTEYVGRLTEYAAFFHEIADQAMRGGNYKEARKATSCEIRVWNTLMQVQEILDRVAEVDTSLDLPKINLNEKLS